MRQRASRCASKASSSDDRHAYGPRLPPDQGAPQRVYDALTTEAALVAWLPPEGMRAEIQDFDPRPGGGYKMTLIYDDADDAPGKSAADRDLVVTRYVELVPGRRIVQQGEFDASDPIFSGMMTVIWELEAAGEGTRVNITCCDVPPGIRRADHEAGLKSSLANLAAFVERV